MSDIKRAGLPLVEAKKALIMIHGRGATADSILSLVSSLDLTDYAILAPQANSNSWYPFGFMAPVESNKVALENSLSILKETWNEIEAAGIKAENTVLLGFSQGACLTLEFSARSAQKFGGVVAFTGGLIGKQIKPENYSGDFQGTPIFIGSSDRDFHVPAKRIKESADLLRKMGADVTIELFDDPDHTIREEEINWVNQRIFI
ncbi:alpha/beta hydrolase [Algoriphagus sp.]|uniref:alpha/beta hydrolase n=1 Tax=Algoriphagus sp. TaxID=1872435 RepID=UPI00391A4181